MIKITTTKDGVTYEHPTGVKQTLSLKELKDMKNEILNKEKENTTYLDDYIKEVEGKKLL